MNPTAPMFSLPLRRTLLPALAAVTAFALIGCALPTAEQAPGQQPTAATAAESLATMNRRQYVTVQPEKTGIVNVADDTRYTYVAFGAPVGADVLFFDDEGKPLQAARVGVISALPGIYKGVLVRTGSDNSYIAPNPRATPTDRPQLDHDPMVVEARNRLDVETTQRPAFERAMQLANVAPRAPETVQQVGASSEARAAARPPHSIPPLPPLAAPKSDDPTYQVTPAGPMVRVFFASGGRAIVRPDDGLQRMEAEAENATQIRVIGYTDSVGDDAVNSALSRMRAEAIRALLVRRGAAPQRIFVAGAGSTNFLADNTTAAGRAMNRRVEVLFVPPAERAAR